MLVKIFWQEGCPNCPNAKILGKRLEKEGIKVAYYNIKTPDGLAEATLYGVLATPTIIVIKDRKKRVFAGAVPELAELRKYLG